MRVVDLNETNSDNEGEEASTSSRSKAPPKYVQRQHLKSQTLGDQRQGVHNRRKLLGGENLANLALLSQIEPKNLYQASEDKFWVKAVNEE